MSLTDIEREALDHLAQAANLISKAIRTPDESQAYSHHIANGDWDEAAALIHNIQHLVMAQAAARAYPTTFRLLGHSLAKK